jgi:DNA repair exonuclease SbcCD ATPase subunit
MKTRIVFWGTNAVNEKVLVALQLDPEQNKVHEWIFPAPSVTEDFANAMMKDWRNDKDVQFPDTVIKSEKALTASESLLSEGIKPDKDDIISRAQTEWHFIVLSHKLKQGFENEYHDLKDKTEKLVKYDNELWDELKNFWDKVQNQVRERNLFKEHAQILRDGTNALFEHLKKLRKAVDEEFDKSSKVFVNNFQTKLEEISQKLSKGLSMQPIFEELKQLQQKLQQAEMNRTDRGHVWDQIDNLFKQIKEKRSGGKENKEGGAGSDRLTRRYDGLIDALGKMQSSIKRDYSDLEFEKRKIANSEGQLEAQIRQAKIKMIDERIRSKEEKLKDMNSTKADLEKRVEQEKQKDIRRQEKDKLEQAKHAVEDRIKDEMRKAAEARKDDSRIEKAAEAITGGKTAHHDSVLDSIGTTLGETLEDVVDTVRAVSEVVGEKIKDFTENLKSDAHEEAKKETEA